MSTKFLYRSMNEYLREKYGERVHKVSLDAGFTCPNRDGSKAVGGCIYCNNESFNFSPPLPLKVQLSEGIEKVRKRFHAKKFFAYFQAYSNTYTSPEKLRDIYGVVRDFPEVVGIAIGTRPDCVPEEVLRVIDEFIPAYEVWVEYGLESSNDESLRRMNRAHTFDDFRDAVLRTRGRGIQIATHIIAGLPWEAEGIMLQTARDVAALRVDAVKIHNLHIVKDTAMERLHQRAPFTLQTLEEYARIAARMLKILPPETIIMRLTAECSRDLLIAPDWCNQKQEIVAAIHRELESLTVETGAL